MADQRSFVNLKHQLDVGTPAEIRVKSEHFEGVFRTRVSEIKPGSIRFMPLIFLSEKVTLGAGEMVEVLFLVRDACYRYDAKVVAVDPTDPGSFELKDADNVDLLDLRTKIRISTDIQCSLSVGVGEASRTVSGRILDIDFGGVGMVSDTLIPSGSEGQLKFTLPETTHGVLQVDSCIRHGREIQVKGRTRFRMGLEFTGIGRAEAQRIFEWIIQQIERTSKTEAELRTADPTCQTLIVAAKAQRIETIWDRMEIMQPQCAFGELGICCRNCLQGPCRIDPFGEGAKSGVCGASAATMVARNLVRMIAAGTASHTEHARHLIEVLEQVTKAGTSGYQISDEQKLRDVAQRLGLAAPGSPVKEVAAAVARAAEHEFFSLDTRRLCGWLRTTLPAARVARLADLNLFPADLYSPIADLLHRTNTGVDTNPTSLLLAGIRCSLADYAALHIATDITDILFGVPVPKPTTANLAVIDEAAVNVAIHGHNPLVGDVICSVARELNNEAVAVGAPHGINVVGICCTGNELLMRHGVPLATNFASQELAILTGALEAMVVDYQCVIPGIVAAAECFHTRIVTTLPMGRLPNSPAVSHLEFDLRDPSKQARQVIRDAIAAYQKRDRKRLTIPKNPRHALVGFSTEAILGALAAVNPNDPLQPLADNIANGNIQGIALLAGCNNALVRQDHNIITIAKGLIAENVLVLATGCCGGALAKAGLMSPEATQEGAGAGLKAVLGAIGESAGLGGPLPPVLHMGSCVDNSRAVDAAVALANRLGVDLDRLPLVASAPEPMAEKALAIGTFAVALGLPVHLGIIPPVMGSPEVVNILTAKVKDLLGGYFIVELNPMVAVERLMEALRERRKGLHI